jgi:hypothetical protein
MSLSAKIINFAKVHERNEVFWKFKFDNDDEIVIKLNSLNADTMDKNIVQRIEFLIQKFNNDEYVVFSDLCKNGYCENPACGNDRCLNPKLKYIRESNLKQIGVMDNCPNGGLTEKHLYLIFEDKKSFRKIFLKDDTIHTVTEALRELADDVDRYYLAGN